MKTDFHRLGRSVSWRNAIGGVRNENQSVVLGAIRSPDLGYHTGTILSWLIFVFRVMILLQSCPNGTKCMLTPPEWIWQRRSHFAAYILGVCDATESQYSIPTAAKQGDIIAVVSKYLKNHRATGGTIRPLPW